MSDSSTPVSAAPESSAPKSAASKYSAQKSAAQKSSSQKSSAQKSAAQKPTLDPEIPPPESSDTLRIPLGYYPGNLAPTRHDIQEDSANDQKMPTNLMSRTKFNTSGKAAQISINSHRILECPTKTVYQYDVC